MDKLSESHDYQMTAQIIQATAGVLALIPDAVYFKSYQLAHDFAKKAERCYRFELGNDDSFISYGGIA